MHLTQPLHRHVRHMPDAVATVAGDRSRTWTETRDAIARFAGALRALGMETGDRVAMLAKNGEAFFDYLYGTWWGGGVINPVNLRWTAQEIAYSLEDCQSAILFVGEDFAPMIDEIRAKAPGLRHVLLIGSPEYRAFLDSAEPVADARRTGDDLAAILYTGGTTGFPKGVMLSHRNLVVSAMGSIAGTDGPARSPYLHTAPLFHIGALSGLFIAMLSGTRNVFLPAFEPVAVMEAVQRHGISDLFMVPTMMRMLIDHPRFAEFDLGSVRRIRYGASPIDGALLDRLLAAFPKASFAQAYGMTELSPVATVLTEADHEPGPGSEARLRSAGRATAVTEVRIVDARDREVAPGEVGEIVVRGDNVMLGYWGMPEATAEATRGGWMHTGDMGRMDANGYVTVVDRLKDMIITGGENVYSVEVENALSTHPDVGAVAVIAMPDERWGEAVHAVIVPRSGAAIEPERLDAHARGCLAAYKVPRGYSVVDELPLTAAGKVAKNILREQAVARAAAKTEA